MLSILYVNSIGSLMYITTHTRLNIAFPIIHLTQFMSNINFEKNAFCVSSSNTTCGHSIFCIIHPVLAFASSKLNKYRLGIHWSKSNYVFHIGGGVISWQSCKQLIVALSSISSKYITINVCAQEALWL
jgi:hypothetical protein